MLFWEAFILIKDQVEHWASPFQVSYIKLLKCRSLQEKGLLSKLWCREKKIGILLAVIHLPAMPGAPLELMSEVSAQWKNDEEGNIWSLFCDF